LQILGRIEASDSCNIGDIGQLEEIRRMLSILVGALRNEIRVEVAVVASSVVITAARLHSELLRHRRESHTFGQVGKRVDEVTLLADIVEEAAAVTELALTRRLSMPELTRGGLVVRMDGTKGCLSEILGQRIVGLSELLRPMCELAVFIEWTFSRFSEMPAELSLILLLERVEMTLISVEIIVVRLLGQVSEHLLRRVVEIALLSGLILVVLGLTGATVRGIRALSGRCFAFVALTTVSKFLTLRLRSLGTLVGALTSILGRHGFLLSGGR